LDAARGIVHGVILGAIGWLIILALVAIALWPMRPWQ
jgi:hypothetical protein